MRKLALGTVQFGLPYGVANTCGQVGAPQAAAILQRARGADMDTLDTAISYGDSEQRLGDIGVHGWRVVTKLQAFPEEHPNIREWAVENVYGSLSRLRISRLSGLLLHRPLQLLEKNGRGCWAALQGLKSDGYIEKVGFSIYQPEDLDALWPSFRPDLVQAPYNLLDRRLEKSGWLERMNEAGVEVHVRSVFLQGLLLMSSADRPRKFERWASTWKAVDDWLEANGITALHAALGLAIANPSIARVIVGVDGLAQLEEILAAATLRIDEFPSRLSVDDGDLINPSRWHLL